jgi:hypothetical protein
MDNAVSLPTSGEGEDGEFAKSNFSRLFLAYPLLTI